MTAPAAERRFTRRPGSYPVVKICGLMVPEHAVAAALAGADMIGLVFAPSKRQVSVERAIAIKEALSVVERRPLLVGVFVNAPYVDMRDTARAVGLDVLQLSGDETPDAVSQCAESFPVLKALRLPPGTDLTRALEQVANYRRHAGQERLRFVVDAHHASAYGGTGTRADWPLARSLAANEPLLLAGGLDPDNVSRALADVSPWGVDVSSGVESAGIKDPELIRAFLGNALSVRPTHGRLA